MCHRGLWELKVLSGLSFSRERNGQQDLAKATTEGRQRNMFIFSWRKGTVLCISLPCWFLWDTTVNFSFKYSVEAKQMSYVEKQKEANDNWNYSGIKGEQDLGRAKWQILFNCKLFLHSEEERIVMLARYLALWINIPEFLKDLII